MHLLHDDLGGKATDSNLAPAKSVYNTQFYNDCEQFAVQDRPTKTLWYSFTISFWGAAGPVPESITPPIPGASPERYRTHGLHRGAVEEGQ